MKYIQDFNYHTHTKRCGHAEDYEDKGYVQEAFETGIKFLAFTDHIPFKETKDTKTNVRMSYDEIDEYMQSIIELKGEYKGLIGIETGFEFEYLPNEIEYLKKIKSMVDKMILGQHFIFDEEGNIKYFSTKSELKDKEMIQYVCLIDKALQQGLPDIIAHPDLFLKYRKTFGKKEEYISREICELAQKYQIPMEINLNEIYREYVRTRKEKKECSDRETIDIVKSKVGYPNKNFWDILSEYDIKVLFGIDAHLEGQIRNRDISYNIASEILGETIENLNFVNHEFTLNYSKKNGKKEVENERG